MQIPLFFLMLWIFCPLVGYLIGESLYATLFGLTVGVGITLILYIIPEQYR